MTSSTPSARRNDLVRGVFNEGTVRGASVDTTADSGRLMYGHFSVFNSPAVIRDFLGEYVETVKPGAFKKTIREALPKLICQYNHGMDLSISGKQLGNIRSVKEDSIGCAYEVDLLDAPHVNDYVLPALKAGLLGSSFRFSIIRDAWRDHPGPSVSNPDGLPERDILEVKLYEFGPVDSGAYAAATAGVRSADEYAKWVRDHYKVDKTAKNYVGPDRRRRIAQWLRIWS